MCAQKMCVCGGGGITYGNEMTVDLLTHATNVVLCIYYAELIKLLCLVLSCLSLSRHNWHGGGGAYMTRLLHNLLNPTTAIVIGSSKLQLRDI